MNKRDKKSKELLRKIPQVEKILQRSDVSRLLEKYGRLVTTAYVRETVSVLREDVRAGRMDNDDMERSLENVGSKIESRIMALLSGSTSPVINGTGVIVHTNLGRSVLDERIIRKLTESAAPYINLEYDLEKGQRGKRAEGAGKLLAVLFPGSAAQVVNNNAAAVLLLLNGLAYRKEVIVSRGELVEIGGSFRIPEIMAKSGAVLREVGTTNKTKVSDYEKAISPKTGLILKVHQSNFMIVGFTEEVVSRELAQIGKKHGIPVIVDQGSGCIVNLKKYGIHNEPSVHDILKEGVDAVCFSGDKLLGGPQAGIIIGKGEIIGKLKKNPMSRALRIDKVTNSLLESTLASYVRGKEFEEIPTLRMIAMTKKEIAERAKKFADDAAKISGDVRFQLVDGSSTIGGGSAPGNEIPTKLLGVSCKNRSAEKIEKALRKCRPPVIGRIKDEFYLLDFRTILPEQESILLDCLRNIAGLL